MRYAALWWLSALSLYGQFAWKDIGSGRLELTEDGKTVAVYNYGPQLPAGVPEDRRRCCYLYPVYTPAGVAVADDFPKDHYHHRGVFWGWPQVIVGGQRLDGWMMRGMEVRHEKMAENKGGLLKIENGWYAGETKIVRESVEIRAEKGHALRITLTLTATDRPVSLSGSTEPSKGYGALSARFAPRTDTVIRTSDGTIAKDEDLNPHAWAEMEAVFNGKKARLRITPDPKNPGEPNPWCLRFYGFVGSSWPAREKATLEPGRPVTLRYLVELADVN